VLKWLRIGLVAFCGIVLVAVFWRGLAGLTLALLVAVFCGVIGSWLYRRHLLARFRAKWGPARSVLLVYSNSPHWQSYIEANWLPRLSPHAVVLNWSHRSKWGSDGSPESRLFRNLGGYREFNPLIVYLPRGRKTQVIRFWKAFRDFKHGKDAKLRKAEAELFAIVDALERSTA
jgi:hypothetical protein